MRTTLTIAAAIVVLAAAFNLRSVAVPPKLDVEVAEPAESPVLLESWGEEIVEGVELSVRRTECAENRSDDGDYYLCFDLVAFNDTQETRRFDFELVFEEEFASEFERGEPNYVSLYRQRLEVNAEPGEHVAARQRIGVPPTVGWGRLRIVRDDLDEWEGVIADLSLDPDVVAKSEPDAEALAAARTALAFPIGQ